jgi:uncharacterized protein
MRTMMEALGIRSLVRKEDIQPTVILLAAALLTTLQRTFGSLDAARRLSPGCDGMTASLFMFSTAFVLFGAIPMLIVLHAFREDPAEYGVRLGDWKFGLRATAVLLPLIAVCLLYPASVNPEMRQAFPFAPEAGRSPGAFIMFQVPRGILFYTAWEFFFRGFILFGLRRYVGDWMAICIQTIPQCLWHIGMPNGELLSSIAGGVLFGVIALRTRSVLWPALLHFAMGIVLDLFIILQR